MWIKLKDYWLGRPQPQRKPCASNVEPPRIEPLINDLRPARTRAERDLMCVLTGGEAGQPSEQKGR